MSTVELKVELPAHSHSLTVHVPHTGTVLDVKEEIAATCHGGPRVHGQKLIWRGRFLQDDEKIAEVWKVAPRIVHLSVHPSAWTSNPPNHAATLRPTPTTPSHTSTSTPNAPYKVPIRSPSEVDSAASPSTAGLNEEDPLVWARFLHRRAHLTLQGAPLVPMPEADVIHQKRSSVVKFMARHGYTWPAFLDEDYPEFQPGGLMYELQLDRGGNYLKLTNPGASPTKVQMHALEVLSYTLSILALPPLPTPAPTSAPAPQQLVTTLTNPSPSELQAVLQQLGLHNLGILLPNAGNPTVTLNPNANPNAGPNANGAVGAAHAGRVLELRPLFFPLLMLAFRTVLLLYFVAPARKPIFGLLIAAWVAYEVWQPIRARILRPRQENPPPGAAPGVGAANGPGQAAAPGAGQQPAGGNNNNNNNHVQRNVALGFNSVTNTIGDLNLNEEGRILTLSGVEGTIQEPEPSFTRKAFMFISLLTGTVHPAVWNRRRAALRRREGPIRTEANVRDAPPPEAPTEEGQQEGESEEHARQRVRESEERARKRAEEIARHERRPTWVRNYLQRVVDADWVEDTD